MKVLFWSMPSGNLREICAGMTRIVLFGHFFENQPGILSTFSFFRNIFIPTVHVFIYKPIFFSKTNKKTSVLDELMRLLVYGLVRSLLTAA
jgi:hypothetical protein